jgi:transposase-like protein
MDSGQRVKTRKEAHMKTQLSKPARSKARYTDEYKQEALELWRASGRSAAKVAAELGIRPPLLYRWAHAERVPDAPKAGGKPKRSLEELGRRTDACARRTPSSWSSVKC